MANARSSSALSRTFSSAFPSPSSAAPAPLSRRQPPSSVPASADSPCSLELKLLPPSAPSPPSSSCPSFSPPSPSAPPLTPSRRRLLNGELERACSPQSRGEPFRTRKARVEKREGKRRRLPRWISLP
ncbi:hypothetical protein GmHk_06G015504 [Glycine max]|nr:hypothetical protein GmHk_06G015504 [Glycine max]